MSLLVAFLVLPFATSLRAVRVQTSLIAASSLSRSPDTSHPADAPPLVPTRPLNQTIALPQIASRSDQLDSLLQEISKQLISMEEVLPSEATQEQADEIRGRALYVESLISGVPTAFELRDESQYWSALDQQYDAQLKVLTSRATYLEEQIHFLDGQETEWKATWDQIHQLNGIEPVAERVRQELEKIRSLRLKVQEQLNLVLTLQNKISEKDHKISEVLTNLGGAQERVRSYLLKRDGFPIWKTRELRKHNRPIISPIGLFFDREVNSAGVSLRSNLLLVLATILLYALGLVTTFYLRRYVRTPGLEVSREARKIVARPFSVALFMALLGTIGRLQNFTIGIAYVFIIFWIIQSLYLLPQLMGPAERSILYALTPFLLIECARILIPLSSVLERELFVLNLLAALVTLIWIARPSRIRRLSVLGRVSFMLVVLVRSEFMLLTASLLSNVFGFISLSQVLGMSALFGLFGAGILYGGMRVLMLLLSILLRTDLAQAVLKTSAGTVERWASRILGLGATLIWLQVMLRIFAIYDAFVRTVSRGLQYSFGYGNVHFTLGSVLSILSTIVIGYAVASALTLTLGNFLLPKLHLNRGVPYAISKITYYVLLLLVAMIALESAGVELNKFTVLTGTLGVGLGFGLQNIVSNFVSGLILLFERPIHIGDTVDVGELVGTVRRIGARSSTVLTFQGAEVIVPNTNLISNQVINWTLSSPWRRVDVPVGVAYGTDPERVLKLLVDVANSHPGVLQVRPPTAFFLGFGESTLNFELRFWAAHQEMWFQLRSDVTVDVSKAFRQAGIEIPFPQRDLHLRSVDVSVGETLMDNGLRSPAAAHPAGSER